MQAFIALALLVALVSARKWRDVSTNLDDLAERDNMEESNWYSKSRWTYPDQLWRASEREKDYLRVCTAEVSKYTETKVRQTLLKVGKNMAFLFQAMDNDDVANILQALQNARSMMTSQIAAIQGTVFAVVQGKAKGGLEDDQKWCVERVLGELRYYLDDLEWGKLVTKNAATEFKEATSNEAFLHNFKQLSDLMAQVDQFIDDPTQISRLQSACQSVKPFQVIEHMVNTLSTIRSEMYEADVSIKLNSIESTAGLLSQGVTLNAICQASQYFNETYEVQHSRLLQDAKQAQMLHNDLEYLIKDIWNKGNIFRLIFGY